MENLISVTGMVLSSMNMGEADRRLLILSREMGKISVFARGARRPGNAFMGCTRPFSFGRFDIYSGRSAYSLHQAEIAEYFEDIVMDVEKSAFGSYFCELISSFAGENMPEEELLKLLYFSFLALRRGKMKKSLIKLTAEIKAVSISGLAPSFSVCGECNSVLFEGFYHPGSLKTLCTKCNRDREGLHLSKSSLYTLEFIEKTPPEKLFSFLVSDDVFSEIKEVITAVLSQSLDKRLFSGELLSVLSEEE